MRTRWLIGLSLALLLSLLLGSVAQAAPVTAPSESSCGYWYTVQPGDSWSRISARTGVSVAALQAANPHLVRPPKNWLYVGDRMWIPCGAPPPPPPPSCGHWYTVRAGDSWSRISSVTGVSVSALQAANPSLVRPPSNWLYVGDRMWIPCGSPPPPTCGYWYTVRSGDSWTRVSQATGIPVSTLQAANPSKVRPPNYWLYAGEKIWIPC
jgi:peptidoglycan DL-endopeptidase LytF